MVSPGHSRGTPLGASPRAQVPVPPAGPLQHLGPVSASPSGEGAGSLRHGPRRGVWLPRAFAAAPRHDFLFPVAGNSGPDGQTMRVLMAMISSPICVAFDSLQSALADVIASNSGEVDSSSLFH